MDVNTIIAYWYNGNTRVEGWFTNNSRHREDGPAYIEYYESGKLERESWHVNRKHHRLDGPAIIWYSETSEIVYENQWIDGKELSDKEAAVYKEWLIDFNLYNKLYHTWIDEEKVLWRLRWI